MNAAQMSAEDWKRYDAAWRCHRDECRERRRHFHDDCDGHIRLAEDEENQQ